MPVLSGILLITSVCIILIVLFYFSCTIEFDNIALERMSARLLLYQTHIEYQREVRIRNIFTYICFV